MKRYGTYFYIILIEKAFPIVAERQISNELDGSRSSIAPTVPPYYGGSVSDLQSDTITTNFSHTDAPFLGESYSQAGHSPAQSRRGAEKIPPAVISVSQDKNACRISGTSQPNSEVKFVENDAYGTVTSVEPKFEIRGGEGRGAVREMVQIRKH